MGRKLSEVQKNGTEGTRRRATCVIQQQNNWQTVACHHLEDRECARSTFRFWLRKSPNRLLKVSVNAQGYACYNKGRYQRAEGGTVPFARRVQRGGAGDVHSWKTRQSSLFNYNWNFFNLYFSHCLQLTQPIADLVSIQEKGTSSLTIAWKRLNSARACAVEMPVQSRGLCAQPVELPFLGLGKQGRIETTLRNPTTTNSCCRCWTILKEGMLLFKSSCLISCYTKYGSQTSNTGITWGLVTKGEYQVLSHINQVLLHVNMIHGWL